MGNTSLKLDDRALRFIQAQIAQGHYRDETEIMQAGLHLLEEREETLATLRAALIEGEQSVPATPFDFDAFIRNRRDAQPSEA